MIRQLTTSYYCIGVTRLTHSKRRVGGAFVSDVAGLEKFRFHMITSRRSRTTEQCRVKKFPDVTANTHRWPFESTQIASLSVPQNSQSLSIDPPLEEESGSHIALWNAPRL